MNLSCRLLRSTLGASLFAIAAFAVGCGPTHEPAQLDEGALEQHLEEQAEIRAQELGQG